MSAVSRSRGLLGPLLWGGAIFGLFWGCKRQPPPPAGPAPGPGSSAAASALPPAEEVSRCRPLPGWDLTLEAEDNAGEKRREAGDDEDDDALLPFGVDIGGAVPTPSGVALGGLRGAGQAFVALVGDKLSRRVDLGQLHGDAEAPAVAVLDERVLIALRGSDAAGFTIKLGSVALASGEAEWGYELSKLGKTVTAVQLAANGARGVLVFQGEDKSGSRLLLGTFAAASGLKEPFEVRALDVKDAETPRLVTRPGGYWLSWVRSLPEPKKPAAPAPSNDPATSDPEERELLDVGLRVLEVAKLDEQGKAMGAARRVGEPRRQVILYDVAPLASGGLLVAARSDSAAPGAEGGALLLSEVGEDGTVRTEQLEDDDIGAGAPTLLVDREVKLPGPWLTVASPSDATRIGPAQGAKTQLHADPMLGHAEIVAVSGGRFLVQRARGRSVLLNALECAWPNEAEPAKK